MDPYISIIIPVYNTEQYIGHCIDSILCQTYRNYEVLLVDDGSSDNSGKICDLYKIKDQRINVFHKKNEGVSIARNYGLNLAKGNWITFVDSDDILDQDWLQCYAENITDDIDIIFQGFIEHSQFIEQKKILDYCSCYIETIYQLEKNDLFGWTWNKIFKANIIKSNLIQFDSKLTINEDLLFTLNYCSFASTIKVLPIAKYHYYIRTGSLLTSQHKYIDIKHKADLILDARKKLICRYGNQKYLIWANDQYVEDLLFELKCSYSTADRQERILIISKIRKYVYKKNKFQYRSRILLYLIITIKSYILCDSILLVLFYFKKCINKNGLQNIVNHTNV